MLFSVFFFFFSSRRRHTRFDCDWSSDVCSSDLVIIEPGVIVTPIFSKAKRFVAPDSPYAHHLRRLLLMYQRQLTNPTPPERVAETIEEAVTTPTPRLRWLVGDDAQRLVAGRRRISDEEFVADASAATDAEWEALMRRRYGFEWP